MKAKINKGLPEEVEALLAKGFDKNYILFINKVRTDFVFYLEQVFRTLNPNEDYSRNWHILLVAELLKMTETGAIKRLNLSIPPRSLKTIICSVAYSMWYLGHNPTRRVIASSFSATLSRKIHDDCRTVANTTWYRMAFPDFSIDPIKSDNDHATKNTQSSFTTTKGGGRLATSTNGSVMGFGADLIIIDDGMPSESEVSDRVRINSLNWHRSTLLDRLNSQKEGVIINIAQRLHEEDLCGFFSTLKTNEGNDVWCNVTIPLYSTIDIDYRYGSFNYKFKANTLLDKKRWSWQLVDEQRISKGTMSFNARYLQNPQPAEGNIIKYNWFRGYTFKDIEDIEFTAIYQSWDTAFKAGQDNDFSVCTTWGLIATSKGNIHYLLNVFRDKLLYPDLKKKLIDLDRQYSPKAILIEDKASGQSLVDDLKQNNLRKVLPIRVTSDKVTRLHSCSALIEAGCVYVDFSDKMVTDLLTELTSFPNAKHDDQVDSVTQYFNWNNKKNIKGISSLI